MIICLGRRNGKKRILGYLKKPFAVNSRLILMVNKEFGNGAERQKALGKYYEDVQRLVNDAVNAQMEILSIVNNCIGGRAAKKWIEETYKEK